MLLRVLYFFALACLFVFLLNSLLSWLKRQRGTRSPGSPEPEEMVLDPQCQSYIPKDQAIFRSGNYFCSEECAKLYLSR